VSVSVFGCVADDDLAAPSAFFAVFASAFLSSGVRMAGLLCWTEFGEGLLAESGFEEGPLGVAASRSICFATFRHSWFDLESGPIQSFETVGGGVATEEVLGTWLCAPSTNAIKARATSRRCVDGIRVPH